MEASEGLLDKIIPPRLEDAGLEDCALPPDSIKEAFLKAASAVGSRAASILSPSDDDDCLHDPWPSAGESSDALVGMKPETGSPGGCAAKKGGGVPDALGGDVNVGLSEAVDKVVGPGDEMEGEGESCVDEALQGLNVGEEDKDNGKDESESERPTLIEGYYV